jgi:RES domain-containing protein
MHNRRYAADDHGGSLRVSGRYHRGRDHFSEEPSFPALYLALDAETCLAELVRHITPQFLPKLNGYRISELTVDLDAVLDCRVPERLGLTWDHLCSDLEYAVTQRIAAAARASGIEGLLVPSATALGDNFVQFPDRLRPTSSISIVGSRDPRLFVERG